MALESLTTTGKEMNTKPISDLDVLTMAIDLEARPEIIVAIAERIEDDSTDYKTFEHIAIIAVVHPRSAFSMYASRLHNFGWSNCLPILREIERRHGITGLRTFLGLDTPVPAADENK